MLIKYINDIKNVIEAVKSGFLSGGWSGPGPEVKKNK
jgi:hypothetical protein